MSEAHPDIPGNLWVSTRRVLPGSDPSPAIEVFFIPDSGDFPSPLVALLPVPNCPNPWARQQVLHRMSARITAWLVRVTDAMVRGLDKSDEQNRDKQALYRVLQGVASRLSQWGSLRFPFDERVEPDGDKAWKPPKLPAEWENPDHLAVTASIVPRPSANRC